MPVFVDSVSLIYSDGWNVISAGIGGGNEPHFH